MEGQPNIIECLESPKIFGPAFSEGKSWDGWKTFLRAMYGLEMSSDELKFFQEATGRQAPNKNGFIENYGVIGSRGGKSRIASLVSVYEALFGGWPEQLAPGEIGWVIVVATNVDQAKNVFRYIKALLNLFPADIIVRRTEEEIVLKNNIGIMVKPAAQAGLRGYTSIAIILDELAYFRSDFSANPCEEIMIALLPRLKHGGKCLGISTPGWKSGYLYQVYKDFWGSSDSNSEFMVWKKSTKEMNPLFRQGIIDRFLKRNKSLYDPEFSAEWRSDEEAFLTEELVEEAMKHSQLAPDPEKKYFCGVDLSGGRKDAATMALAFKDRNGKVIVARCEARRSPYQPDDICREFSAIMKAYKIYETVGDNYAANWPIAMFAKYGINLKNSEKNRSEVYLETQSLFTCHQIAIPNDKELLAQFVNLELRPSKTGGRDAVVPDKNLHDDLANAVALSATLANGGGYLTKEQIVAKGGGGIVRQRNWGLDIVDRYKTDAEREADKMAKAKREFEKDFMREGAGIPDRSKPNPWNKRGPGDDEGFDRGNI